MAAAATKTAGETKRKRGFAALTPERQREIARMGGKRAHEVGSAHHFTREEARAAGARGGATVSADRAHMAEIGRAGGLARGKKYKASTETEG